MGCKEPYGAFSWRLPQRMQLGVRGHPGGRDAEHVAVSKNVSSSATFPGPPGDGVSSLYGRAHGDLQGFRVTPSALGFAR
jgi:hypothetical protein